MHRGSMQMEWTRSETLALAANFCARCHGIGLLESGRRRQSLPCSCVSRRIFRACYARLREILSLECQYGQVTKHICSGPNRRVTFGMKNEEYVADFHLISLRVLTAQEHRIYRYHFLLGADYKLCCRKLGLDRGTFFHAVYRIEVVLGRAFAETLPFPLFPVEQYFRGLHQDVLKMPRIELKLPKGPKPLQPPVRRAA